ncbi:MAG: FKBP-type peptidyl-prolyl cis-trans isomerase [Chloroflexota bacterium]
MTKATQGSTVTVHYTGKLTDGTVFDTSMDREPLQFTIGAKQVIPGFESAVDGMQPGESKTVQIPADEAYGEHREDMILEVGQDQIPDDLDPKVGDQLRVTLSNGQTALVAVHAVGPESISLDANHPLAGKDLVFDIELVDVA